MSEPDDQSDEMSEAEEEAWCAERREQVIQYLATQPGERGEVGERPAWHIAPILSIWAIESLARPGAVGWWVICGEVPTDYCYAEQPAHPRKAMVSFCNSWTAALASYRPGDVEIGDTRLPGWLADHLRSRVEMLRECAEDDALWPED